MGIYVKRELCDNLCEGYRVECWDSENVTWGKDYWFSVWGRLVKYKERNERWWGNGRGTKGSRGDEKVVNIVVVREKNWLCSSRSQESDRFGEYRRLRRQVYESSAHPQCNVQSMSLALRPRVEPAEVKCRVLGRRAIKTIFISKLCAICGYNIRSFDGEFWLIFFNMATESNMHKYRSSEREKRRNKEREIYT